MISDFASTHSLNLLFILVAMYYRGAAAAIIVYDITRASTFKTLKTWIEELHNQGPKDIAIAIAGNKADLEDSREVDRGMALAYAEEIGENCVLSFPLFLSLSLYFSHPPSLHLIFSLCPCLHFRSYLPGDQCQGRFECARYIRPNQQ